MVRWGAGLAHWLEKWRKRDQRERGSEDDAAALERERESGEGGRGHVRRGGNGREVSGGRRWRARRRKRKSVEGDATV